MAVKAIIPSGWGEITVHGLHQWDYGQTLEIQSVDIGTKVAEIHFACKSMTEAIVRPCSFTNGVGSVAIPDRCLEQTFPITAWVYEVGESSGVTVKTITLPIIERTRPQPGEEHISEDVSNRYTEVIEEMNELLERQAAGEIVAGKANRATSAEEADFAKEAGAALTVDSQFKVALAEEADHAAEASKAGSARIADKAGRATSSERLHRTDVSISTEAAPHRIYIPGLYLVCFNYGYGASGTGLIHIPDLARQSFGVCGLALHAVPYGEYEGKTTELFDSDLVLEYTPAEDALSGWINLYKQMAARVQNEVHNYGIYQDRNEARLANGVTVNQIIPLMLFTTDEEAASV